MCMAMNHAHHNGKLEFIFPRSVYSGKYGTAITPLTMQKKNSLTTDLLLIYLEKISEYPLNTKCRIHGSTGTKSSGIK